MVMLCLFKQFFNLEKERTWGSLVRTILIVLYPTERLLKGDSLDLHGLDVIPSSEGMRPEFCLAANF